MSNRSRLWSRLETRPLHPDNQLEDDECPWPGENSRELLSQTAVVRGSSPSNSSQRNEAGVAGPRGPAEPALFINRMLGARQQ